MSGKSVSAQEGNWSSPSYISKLGKDLLTSLQIEDDKVYYAISCPCCDFSAYYWYMSRIKNKNITFANLWINSNYPKFIESFESLKRDAVLIANFRAENAKIGNLNILKHYKIDDDCISFWENQAPSMIEEIKKNFGNKNDLLYVVSAGPMSGVIIEKLFKNNPNNCYIDFGSAIDKYYRENVTRPYMQKGNIYAKRCCWMYNTNNFDFDVSVVLNLYKRPENLELQLNAIKNQSLLPKEILLYKDGIKDGIQGKEKIEIPENIKNEFSLIQISDKNLGVWERFKFAQNAKSKYVCVFDDDTIPGENWLANCHKNIIEQEGLYGTIGIILEKPEVYPKEGFFRVGWDGNSSRKLQVDFVGHSWFFKKEWLNLLFDETEEFQKFKTAGEDMCFSSQLQKKGIKTFVPPHPKNTEFWGSLPEYSLKLGLSECATSLNPDSLDNMNKSIKMLLNSGWKPIIKTNPVYVKIAKYLILHYNKKESGTIKFLLNRGKHIVNKKFKKLFAHFN